MNTVLCIFQTKCGLIVPDVNLGAHARATVS